MTAARIPQEPPTDPGLIDGAPLRERVAQFMSRVLARLDTVDARIVRLDAKLDDASTLDGQILGELGRLSRRLDKIRPDSDRPISFHDLDELRREITAPGVPDPETRPSSPIRATVEKWTGKIVIRVFLFVGGVGAGLAVEHVILSLLHR